MMKLNCWAVRSDVKGKYRSNNGLKFKMKTCGQSPPIMLLNMYIIQYSYELID